MSEFSDNSRDLVVGMADLSRKLKMIGDRASARAMSSAATRATTPVVKAMRSAAPVGTVGHKTYRGRWVAPGYGSRSIAKRVKFDRATGTAKITIGVRKEAFYLIQWYDQRSGRAPYTITGRRVKGKSVKSVKPYTLPAKPWFSSVFINAQSQIVERFRAILKTSIEKAARGN